MNKAILIASLVLFLAIGAFSMHGVLAYELEVPIGTTTEVTDLPHYISVVYRFAIGIISLLAVLLIIYGGFNWVIAAGNETRISDAKATILAAVIGLIIALTSYTLLNTINPNLVNLRVNIPVIPTTITGGTTTGTYTGGGECSTCADGTGCGVSDLVGAGFEQADAEAMAKICSIESSCGNPAPSETDFCIEMLPEEYQGYENISYVPSEIRETVSNLRKQYSTSMGIFQIHLPVESTIVNGEPCSAAFDGYSSGGVWGDHCTIVNQPLYDACREKFLHDVPVNLEAARQKYYDGGDPLRHWGYTAYTVCGFDQ